MTRRWLAVVALLATAGAWGATFTIIKDVVERISPEAFIAYRFTLAGAILLIAARKQLSRKLLLPGICLGVVVLAGYLTQTHGLRFISPSRSAFLTGLYVVMVPFMERGQSRKWNAWLAALLAVIGTTVLVGGFDARMGDFLTLGDLLTLFCAVMFALHVVLSARWSTNETSAALAAVQVLFVGLACAPLSLFARATQWDRGVVIVILFTAVVTTALAFAAMMWAQAHVTATEAAVILSFEPVAAALTSMAFEGEALTLAFVIGALLILAAMLLSQIR